MLHLISLGLISLGLIAIFSGIVGLFKLPDFYTKLHAASIIDSCGVPLCLIGLAFACDNFANVFKLLFAFLLVMLLSPVTTYAIGKASVIMNSQNQVYHPEGLPQDLP